MLYIDSKLVKNKEIKPTSKGSGDGFEDFCELFKANLNDNLTIKKDKPIIVRYSESIYQDDPDNPGKKMFPIGISLSYVAKTVIDGSETVVRYSPSTPIRQEGGELKWPIESTLVDKGHLAITDIDLAFFFWRYSIQNEANDAAPEHMKKLRIENLEYERQMEVAKKRMNSTINARLYNEVKDGGLSDERIILVGKHFMLKNISENSDPNDVRLQLERAMAAKPALKKQFLSLTDEEEVDDQQIADRRKLISDAIEYQIIGNNKVKKQFELLDAEGKVTEVILKYPKNVPLNEMKETLYAHIEINNPDLFEKIKDRLAVAASAEV